MDTTANDIVLRKENQSELVLENNGVEVARQPLVENTTVIVTGADDIDDTLTVDFSGGNPIPTGGVQYEGGVAGFDILRIVQGVAQTVTHVFENRSAGQVEIDGAVIAYIGLEPIIDRLEAVNRFFTFQSDNNDITLADDGVTGNGMSRISSVGSSETVDFLIPQSELRLDAGPGDDHVLVKSLDGDTATVGVKVDGQGGANTIDTSSFPGTVKFAASNRGSLVLSVDENTVRGSVLGQIDTTKASLGQTVRYAISGGNASNSFAIDSETGMLAVSTDDLNYETTPTETLTVSVKIVASERR